MKVPWVYFWVSRHVWGDTILDFQESYNLISWDLYLTTAEDLIDVIDMLDHIWLKSLKQFAVSSDIYQNILPKKSMRPSPMDFYSHTEFQFLKLISKNSKVKVFKKPCNRISHSILGNDSKLRNFSDMEFGMESPLHYTSPSRLFLKKLLKMTKFSLKKCCFWALLIQL